MQVQLLQSGSLSIVVSAIRKCYESEGRSDSYVALDGDFIHEEGDFVLGPKDEELIRRIVASGHHSTIEHLSYTFDIDGISRGCLHELVRHRIASMSVKSTRYTLGKIKDEPTIPDPVDEEWTYEGHELIDKYLVMLPDDPDTKQFLKDTFVNVSAIRSLKEVQQLAREGIPNDKLKYAIPEAFKTSLIWTINARSLRNFLALRLDKRAHWEIRDLATKVKELIPEQHRILFEDLNVNCN